VELELSVANIVMDNQSEEKCAFTKTGRPRMEKRGKRRQVIAVSFHIFVKRSHILYIFLPHASQTVSCG
jgi:hypothetical protein